MTAPLLALAVSALLLLAGFVLTWRLGWLERVSDRALAVAGTLAGLLLAGAAWVAHVLSRPLPSRKPETRTAAQDEVAEMDAVRERLTPPDDAEARATWREREAERLNREGR